MGIHGVLKSAILVAAVAALFPGHAEAQCTTGTCDAVYCEINCPTSADKIVFGTLYRNGVKQNPGVCRWNSGGTFQDVLDTGRTSGDYRVRADGAAVTGGADTVRLASPAGAETCGSYGGYNWTIKGELPVNSTFLFWGDVGADIIYLCDRENPTASDCIAGGSADGRADNDDIYGSTYGDQLWGSGGADDIYGRAGDDDIWGGDGNDLLDGSTGADELYGGGGTDYMDGGDGNDIIGGGDGNDDEGYGRAGCDIIDGGAGTGDLCHCGATNTYGEGIAWQYCDIVTNCPGCPSSKSDWLGDPFGDSGHEPDSENPWHLDWSAGCEVAGPLAGE